MGDRAKILFVDDNGTLRRVLSAVLEDEGYTVVQADSAVAAVRALGSGAADADLVITDLVMPNGKGNELLFHLRKRRGSLPVLLVSGYPRTDVERLFGVERGVAFLQKPFTLQELVEQVRGMLGAGCGSYSGRFITTDAMQPGADRI